MKEVQTCFSDHRLINSNVRLELSSSSLPLSGAEACTLWFARLQEAFPCCPEQKTLVTGGLDGLQT